MNYIGKICLLHKMKQDFIKSEGAGTNLQKLLQNPQSYSYGILNFIQIVLKPCRRYDLHVRELRDGQTIAHCYL